MFFTFLNSGGTVAFVRDDAEEARWTEEEMSLQCTFPYDAGKVITRGMRILFQDPATDAWQAYEIRQCVVYPGDSSQQITAEDIAISELMDCHIPTGAELNNVTAGNALGPYLTGTGWSIGTNTATNKSSGDISRGSVWDAVGTIQTNWNVYITPRVTVGANGITNKYLDIAPAGGVWRGLRLGIETNVTDPCVTYDDSEVYTALYGYGGSSSSGGSSDEITFASQVWTQTASHPAKPAGQKYLEWPEKTALYGRNGQPRFNYYQNTQIKSGSILLQKTWETLKTCCDPKVSITGTVTDLKRLGYNGQPLRLHDMAIIDILTNGDTLYKEIVQLTVDLLDPTDNQVTIGDYIPNIIYINRDTESYATGGGAGVGDDGGSTLTDKLLSEYEARQDDSDYDISQLQDDVATNTEDIATNAQNIATNTQNIATNTGNIAINAHDISVNADNIDLVTTKANENGDILAAAGISIDPNTGVAVYALDYTTNIGSMLQVQSNKIGMVVGTINGTDYIKAAEIALSINQSTGQTEAKINADHIYLNGNTTISSLFSSSGSAMEFSVSRLSADELSLGQQPGFTYGGQSVTWKSKTIVTDVGVMLPQITLSGQAYFLYSNSSSTTADAASRGRIIKSFTDGYVSPTTETIYYLGGNPPNA